MVLLSCYFLYCVFAGDLESGPVLMDVTIDKCVYMFEWQTAAACVLSHSTGSNCKVFDKKAGNKLNDNSNVVILLSIFVSI